MIKVNRTIPHALNAEKKTNVPPTQKEVKKQKSPQDELYILDLSGLKEQDKQNVPFFHDSTDFLDISEEAQEKLWGNIVANMQAEGAENEEGTSGDLTDNSRRLTRMIVMAKTPLDVQDVLSEAHKDKLELIKAAAFGDERAKAIIKKLDKVIRRGHRKVRDLSKEIQMLQRQQRAEKKEQEQIARQIREQLKRAQLERKQRERKYLDERDNDDDDEAEPLVSGPSMAATEAKIRALAQAMADLKTTSNTGSDAAVSSMDGAAAVSGADSGEAVVAGGETAEAAI